jgi:pimeloyl-ACP methyl ester carboxylesterase
MERVEVEGLSIAYERAGNGPPLVLLHGYVADGPTTWRHQIDELCKDFAVVAWDAPGAGHCADPPETFGINAYADCLAGFVDALGLGRAHVMGLSFGGALALAFQHRHSEVVRTMVLASAYAGWRGSLPLQAAEARLTQAIQVSMKSGRDFVDALLPTMFALPVDPRDFEAFRTAMEAFHPAGFRCMASALAEDLRGLLPDISIPTLLVYGDNNQRAPMAVAEHLHHAISTSQLAVLKGAGHVCNVELPRLFNEVVRAFLSEHRFSG